MDLSKLTTANRWRILTLRAGPRGFSYRMLGASDGRAGTSYLSRQDAVKQINIAIRRMPLAPFLLLPVLLLAVATGSLASYLSLVDIRSAKTPLVFPPLLSWFAGLAVFAPGLAVVWIWHREEERARTTLFRYHLTLDLAEQFGRVQRALHDLAQSDSLWQVPTGASTSRVRSQARLPHTKVNRKRALAREMPLPFLQTGFPVNGISTETMRLYFLPDQVLLWREGQYETVGYESLQVRAIPIQFVQDKPLPRDAEVVGHSYRHLGRDGQPDPRVSPNPRLPVVRYAQLEFLSDPRLRLVLYASRRVAAEAVARSLSNYGERMRGWAKGRPFALSDELDPYVVLQVTPGAAPAEITAAFHRMAQMYHPDKVAGLAAEFRELAEQRMKEINAAYERIKKGTLSVTPRPARAPAEPPVSIEDSEPVRAVLWGGLTLGMLSVAALLTCTALAVLAVFLVRGMRFSDDAGSFSSPVGFVAIAEQETVIARFTSTPERTLPQATRPGPTTVAQPSAAVSGRTTSLPYLPQGSKIAVDTWKVGVTRVVLTTSLSGAGVMEKARGRFAILFLDVTNTGTAPDTFVALGRVAIKDAWGQAYAENPQATLLALDLYHADAGANINPNTVAHVVAAFDISPSSDYYTLGPGYLSKKSSGNVLLPIQ